MSALRHPSAPAEPACPPRQPAARPALDQPAPRRPAAAACMAVFAAGLTARLGLATLPTLLALAQPPPPPLVTRAPSAPPPATAPAPGDRTVSVLYAGSLAAVMENGVGPAFTRATGYAYEGEAQGSLGAAQMIRDGVRRPDVFISADPLVNDRILMGAAHHDLVRWYATLAASQLVIGYNPRSRFLARFEAAKANHVPWYEVLETPGVRFGRGDPTIDPKGYRTLFMFRLAASHYHRPELAGLPGDPENPAQVFPEIVLLARLESGQFDAGIFYRHEAVAHQLPFLTLPPEINLGDPRFAALYARESYTSPAGQRVTGAPILFTLTIPQTVRHREAALAFARYLLTADPLLERFGFARLTHRIGGDPGQVPPELRALCAGTFAP